jgi:two-component system, NarL family, invasion response regulator UvrY
MKILLVDDHAVVRAGIRHLLANEFDLSVLEAASSQKGLDIFIRERPDLVILELNLSGTNGLEFVRQLVERDKYVKILVLSMHSEPVYVWRALQTGVCGYISKQAPSEEFVEAVRLVSSGKRYIERGIAAQSTLGLLSEGDPVDQLTARELDLLRLLAQGKTYGQIAAALGVSDRTVSRSLSAIRDKFAISTNTDLVHLAVKKFGR